MNVIFFERPLSQLMLCFFISIRRQIEERRFLVADTPFKFYICQRPPMEVPRQPPLHPLAQKSWQLLPQSTSQVLIQVSAQPPRQLLSSGSSFSQDERIDGPNTVRAKMGSAPLAALLKNSLRDWSSSFFFDFFITLEVFLLPPNSQIQRYWLSFWK